MLPLTCPGSNPGECGTTMEFEPRTSRFSGPTTWAAAPFIDTRFPSLLLVWILSEGLSGLSSLLFLPRTERTSTCWPFCCFPWGLNSRGVFERGVCVLVVWEFRASREFFLICDIQKSLLSFLSKPPASLSVPSEVFSRLPAFIPLSLCFATTVARTDPFVLSFFSDFCLGLRERDPPIPIYVTAWIFFLQ